MVPAGLAGARSIFYPTLNYCHWAAPTLNTERRAYILWDSLLSAQPATSLPGQVNLFYGPEVNIIRESCVLWCDLFLPCFLLTQDALSEDQWMEAEEAAASAKVREVTLWFDDNSRQRSRAVQSISNGLAKNRSIRRVRLYCVPKEMKESVKQTLKTVTHVYVY